MVTQRMRRRVYPMLFMAVFHVNTRVPWAHVEIFFVYFFSIKCVKSIQRMKTVGLLSVLRIFMLTLCWTVILN